MAIAPRTSPSAVRKAHPAYERTPAASRTGSPPVMLRSAPTSGISNTSAAANVRARYGFWGRPRRGSTPALNQDSVHPVSAIEASGAWKISAASLANSPNPGSCRLSPPPARSPAAGSESVLRSRVMTPRLHHRTGVGKTNTVAFRRLHRVSWADGRNRIGCRRDSARALESRPQIAGTQGMAGTRDDFPAGEQLLDARRRGGASRLDRLPLERAGGISPRTIGAARAVDPRDGRLRRARRIADRGSGHQFSPDRKPDTHRLPRARKARDYPS